MREWLLPVIHSVCLVSVNERCCCCVAAPDEPTCGTTTQQMTTCKYLSAADPHIPFRGGGWGHDMRLNVKGPVGSFGVRKLIYIYI